MGAKKGTLKERLYRHTVLPTDPTDCWIWVGAKISGGYGTIRDGRKVVKAHRASWVVHNGEIPEGEGYHGTCVCHKCDNRLCVNPAHLFLGSNLDNMKDRDTKGRRTAPRGAAHPMAKISEDTARYCAAEVQSGRSAASVAAEVGLTPFHVGRIARGQAWAHLSCGSTT